MPLFTLHRNHTLRTTKGHTIVFVKGEPVWVPPACIQDAVSIGALPQEKIPDVLGDEPKPITQMTTDERDKKLREAFDLLIARNDRGDFTASGLPSIKKLSDITGFDVTNSLRDAVWMTYTAEKAGE